MSLQGYLSPSGEKDVLHASVCSVRCQKRKKALVSQTSTTKCELVLGLSILFNSEYHTNLDCLHSNPYNLHIQQMNAFLYISIFHSMSKHLSLIFRHGKPVSGIPVSSSCCIFSAVLEKTWLRSQTAGKSAFEHFSHFSRLEKKCKNETAQIGAKTAQNDAKTAQNSGNHQKRMIFLKTTCFLPNCKNYCSFGKQHFFRAPGWYRYSTTHGACTHKAVQ